MSETARLIIKGHTYINGVHYLRSCPRCCEQVEAVEVKSDNHDALPPCQAHPVTLAGDCDVYAAWVMQPDMSVVIRRRKPRRLILKTLADQMIPIWLENRGVREIDLISVDSL